MDHGDDRTQFPHAQLAQLFFLSALVASGELSGWLSSQLLALQLYPFAQVPLHSALCHPPPCD